MRGAPEVLGQVPVSCLAEEIDTPGEGQIKALITVAGNPVLSAPGAERLQNALPDARRMISIDNWINETTRHAHVILPGLSPLEQPHFDDLLWQFAVRSAGKWSDAIFPPTDGRPGEWEILVRLAGDHRRAAGGRGRRRPRSTTGSSPCLVDGQRARPGRGAARSTTAAAPSGCSTCRSAPVRSATATARSPDGITLQTFKDNPDGLDFGPMVPRVREHPAHAVGKGRARAARTSPPTSRACGSASTGRPTAWCMISRRHLRSNNSWMHSVPTLVGGTNRCTLLINPGRRGATPGSPTAIWCA